MITKTTYKIWPTGAEWAVKISASPEQASVIICAEKDVAIEDPNELRKIADLLYTLAEEVLDQQPKPRK